MKGKVLSLLETLPQQKVEQKVEVNKTPPKSPGCQPLTLTILWTTYNLLVLKDLYE